jgi:hypothetical protein
MTHVILLPHEAMSRSAQMSSISPPPGNPELVHSVKCMSAGRAARLPSLLRSADLDACQSLLAPPLAKSAMVIMIVKFSLLMLSPEGADALHPRDP